MQNNVNIIGNYWAFTTNSTSWTTPIPMALYQANTTYYTTPFQYVWEELQKTRKKEEAKKYGFLPD